MNNENILHLAREVWGNMTKPDFIRARNTLKKRIKAHGLIDKALDYACYEAIKEAARNDRSVRLRDPKPDNVDGLLAIAETRTKRFLDMHIGYVNKTLGECDRNEVAKAEGNWRRQAHGNMRRANWMELIRVNMKKADDIVGKVFTDNQLGAFEQQARAV